MTSVHRIKVGRRDTANDLVAKLSEPDPRDLWDLPPDPALDARLARDLKVVHDAAARAGSAAGRHVDAPVRIIGRRTTSLAGERIVAPNGETLIVLNQGFLLFVYNFMRILAAHFSFADESEPAPPAPTPTEAARRITELLDWSSSILELPRVRTFPVTPTQMSKASEFTSVAQLFLIAHEYSHVLSGHTSSETEWLRIGEKEIQGITWSQAQEHEADVLGLVLITRALLDRGADLHPQNYAAVEMLLHSSDLVDRFGNKQPSRTHPSAALRRQSLRQSLSVLRPHDWKVIIQNAQAIEQMLRAWDPLIVEQTHTRRALVNARIDAVLTSLDAASQRKALDALLNEYPTATISRIRTELEQWDPDNLPKDPEARRLYAARALLFLYVKLGTHPAVRQALALAPKNTALSSLEQTNLASFTREV